ncbi:MAG: TnsA endonuclease N-terminal domain-containing protein [Candidatus Helarchaeota archaeon]
MSINWSSVRKIPPKTRGNRGFFPSNKVPEKFVEYESQLERNFYLQLEHDPAVIRYQHQPVKIEYKDEKGKTKSYTPDVYIEFSDGNCVLVEIKNEESLLNNYEELELKFAAAKSWAKRNGCLFAVITEKEIKTTRMANIWYALGASKCIDNDKYIKSLVLLISPDGEKYNLLCFQLAEELGVEIGKASQIICYAIYHGLVFVDTFSTRRLSEDTIIRKRTRIKRFPFKPLWEEYDWFLDQTSEDTTDSQEFEDATLKSISSNIPLKYQEEVEKRHLIVKAWLKQPSKKRTSQWRKNFCKQWMVPQRTLYYWISSYKKNGINGLVPNFKNAGRPKKFDQSTFELIEKARKQYLKPNITLKKAFNNLVKLCKKSETSPPSISSFRRYVNYNTTASELAYYKRGRRAHKSDFTPSFASFQEAVGPMQVLQFDNTPFDVFLVDSEQRLPLSTPYLTASIDCHTRMITGFYLSFSPSSSQTVLEVLVQSILSKKNYTQIYETEQEWPIQGFPVLILVDNGMDYRSLALKEFCMKYDIILEYAPVRTPRYKAFIEQWFNVLRQGIKDEVPGYRPLLRKRLENPDLKPEAEAVCTLQEIEKWLHKWIVDEYHFTNSYDDHVLAPFVKFDDIKCSSSKIIIPLPREPPRNHREIALLYLDTLDKDKRTLRSDGITKRYLKYNNKELSRIFNILGEKQKVFVLLDRKDIRYIWVINPIDNNPIKVELASGWAATLLEAYGNLPIYASAWQRDVQAIKIRVKNRLTPYSFRKEYSRLEREKLVSTAKKESKRVRREQEKVKESSRKSIQSKILVNKERNIPINSELDEYDDLLFKTYQPELMDSDKPNNEEIFQKYQPKGLETSKYPSKEYMEG